MRKNGFTLAELLGVIVLLSLISIITIPAVTDSLNNYKGKICKTQLDQIVSAARAWANDNVLKLPTENGATYTVNLETLSEYGYIEGTIENPVTKKNFDQKTTKVVITRSGKRYTYQISYDTSNNSC